MKNYLVKDKYNCIYLFQSKFCYELDTVINLNGTIVTVIQLGLPSI